MFWISSVYFSFEIIFSDDFIAFSSFAREEASVSENDLLHQENISFIYQIEFLSKQSKQINLSRDLVEDPVAPGLRTSEKS